MECSRKFPDDGETPNHPRLPLLITHADELASADDPALWLEERFVANGWGGTWRWGVYPFHHYHTNTHEALGVFSGSATLMLGGRDGEEFDVGAGDVIVLPAGTGHKCISATADFQVVGAYPGGVSPDLIRLGEGDIRQARLRIARVPLPETDPLGGSSGSLLRVWIG